MSRSSVEVEYRVIAHT